MAREKEPRRRVAGRSGRTDWSSFYSLLLPRMSEITTLRSGRFVSWEFALSPRGIRIYLNERLNREEMKEFRDIVNGERDVVAVHNPRFDETQMLVDNQLVR